MRRIVLRLYAKVSKQQIASIFRAMRHVFCVCVNVSDEHNSSIFRAEEKVNENLSLYLEIYSSRLSRIQGEKCNYSYSGLQIIESLGNVTVRGEKDGKSKGGARLSTVCLSMYENIYYSQLSSVATLLQPEPNCFTSYNTRKGLCSLSLCAIVFRSPPASHVSSSNGQWSSQLFCVHYTHVALYGCETWSLVLNK
jgi:hypothetical protein